MAIITENNGDARTDSGTQYTLPVGDVFHGTLAPVHDRDWIRVELAAETGYEFNLFGVESARFELFSSAGNHVEYGRVFSYSKFTYTPAVSGVYYIHVDSFRDDELIDYEVSVIGYTTPLGTYDGIADYLTYGYLEQMRESARAFDLGPGGTLTADITTLSEADQQLARRALGAWANVTGIKFGFVENDNAQITFDDAEEGNFTLSTVNGGVIVSSHVNISANWLVENGTTPDSRSLSLHQGQGNGLPSYGQHLERVPWTPASGQLR